MTLNSVLLSALAVAPLQGGPVPDPVVLLSSPVALVDNYYLSLPSNCAGMALGSGCHATLVGIYYPIGEGPPSLGYSSPPRPVFINLRGGNGNPAFPELYQWFHENVLPKGFVGVDPNYPVVYPGQDYTAAAEGVATLIQYLRHHSAWLNIDPDRIFLFGRSFGAFLSFTLGLKEDYQDLGSPDPLEQHSSRPDFILPFSGSTDLSCFGPTMLFDYFLLAYFPVALGPGATLEQQLADSPIYWLPHPELYGRTETPPMCMGYDLGFWHPCGTIDDPHDGYFGTSMWEALDDYVVQTNDPALGLSSVLIDTDDLWGYTAKMDKATNWAVAQLSGAAPASMYLSASDDPLGATGSAQSLKALGALPGNPVYFFFGFASGPVFVPGCPNIALGIPTFWPLGAGFADAQGRASLGMFVPPIAIGLPLVFHAVDFANCWPSNVLAHQWTE